ncbi:hypothetical protein HY622_04325 [Candidatus Uhrbacteria bacterium]|nr:hypothetical protein [Candidatus Uhrbacteria bacterium]
MKQSGSIHDQYPQPEQGASEWDPIMNKEDRFRARLESITRKAENWLAKAEKMFAFVPGAPAILEGVRNEIRRVRSDAQEQLLLAGLWYGKEYSAHQRDGLKAMLQEEGRTVEELTRNPGLFVDEPARMIQSMKIAEVALGAERLSVDQREYYKKEISSTKHIVYDVYLGQLRKDAHREFDQGKLRRRENESVRSVADEIKESGVLNATGMSSQGKKETFLKRLLLAQDQRKAALNLAINKNAQAAILERLIAGIYDRVKNPLAEAQRTYREEVESQGGTAIGEFPPDMSFGYGFFTFDKADRLDHIENFLQSERKKQPKR